jgi:V/A-type H+-transporting ATPase subunit E
MSVEGIIERIIAEAETEAKQITSDAQREAQSIREQGKREAEEYFEKQKALLEEKYKKETERRVLTKRLDQRKNLLNARQKWMDRAFSNAYQKLFDQPFADYKNLMVTLVQKVSQTKDEVILFGQKGEGNFLEEVIGELNEKTKGNFSLSKKRGDFPWGFILLKDKVEVNMSIDSLFRYKRNDLEQKAWEIFHADL